MKKIILSLAICLTLSSVFALEWGGAISNVSEISGKKFDSSKLDPKDSVRLWLKTPFTSDGNTYFATEGMYQFRNKFATETIKNNLDFTLLKIATQFETPNGTLYLSLGRFYSSDATSIIFTQASDGLFLRYVMPSVSVSAFASYTGLLNASLITMLDSKDVHFSYNTSSVYPLAQKYIPLEISATFERLFFNQDLAFEVWNFLDVSEREEKYNRMYGTVKLSGPLMSELFYSLSSTFLSENFKNLANLSSIDFNYFMPFLSSSINANCVYASGENGSLSSFRAFTSNTAYYALSQPEYTGIIKGGLSFSIKPINQLFCKIGSDVVFACPNNNAKYDGTQIYGNVKWQIVSDVQLSFTTYHFFAKNADERKTAFILSGTIAF